MIPTPRLELISRVTVSVAPPIVSPARTKRARYEPTIGMRPACAALGIAFQLSDDILDVTSESLQSGKTPGTDLREGVRSMPVLHALATAGPGDARLVELLSSDLSDPALLDEALGLLRKHPGMDLARADVRHWANKAREHIAALPDVPARAAFTELCDFMVDRTS